MTDRRRRLSAALDYTVFAPIGFALEVRQLMPTLAERGRRQVEMARMVGRFAVQQGQVEATKRVSALQDRADGVLGEFGLRPLPSADFPDPTPAASAAAAAPVATPSDAGPAVDVNSIAIPGYDSLAASQVIPRLEGLSPDELDAVARYEARNRGRKTILGKISQLRDV